MPSVAFGAGPVPALWTSDHPERHDRTLRRALESGIDWFDTAAGYGNGSSERHLGAAIRRAGAVERVDVATKVRLEAADLDDLRGAVHRSVAASLQRLGLPKATLIQLHNSITARRDDEPTSLTVADVLGPGGVADALEEVRAAGSCDLIGFTGIGQGEALRETAESGRFQTLQIPYHLANSTADRVPPRGFLEADYGQVLSICERRGIGVFAIRVFAGGALAGKPPSEHTRQTRFFKLDLYERDLQRGRRAQRLLPPGLSLPEAAVRFTLSHPAVASALLGMTGPDDIVDAARWAARGPLPADLAARLTDSLD